MNWNLSALRRIMFVLLIGPALTTTVRADDSWQKPLAVKEREIEEGIRQRHNIQGLYPSMVEIPQSGDVIDITTTNPFADIQHAVCWTSNYLAGLSYKYAFLKNSGASADELADAKRRVDEVFEAVFRCQRVTGVRGLQARGYFLGHGETYAEREASSKLPFWRQGEADGQPYRWVGDPSHHNYSDAIHGLGQYYTLAAEGTQKERAREAIDALVSYWLDNDLMIAKFDTSLPAVPILGLTDGKTLNTRVMMAIAGAKVAHVATGQEKFRRVYDQLLDQYGVRDLEVFRKEKDFDDAEHVFCHLDLLFRIETDPQLLAAYRKVADGIWTHHRQDAQSLFTYIYFQLAPDAEGRDEALADALRSLRTWPTDMTLKPRMNSLNKSLQPPYPTYLAAWDNEYIWKGNLLRSDGWLSRVIVDVAVSPEDPAVIYAVEEGGTLYQSRDNAATWRNWRPVDSTLRQHVLSVDVGRRSRILVVATRGGFFLSTTAGTAWRALPVPTEVGEPVEALFDPHHEHVIYAIGTRGVARSRDFGPEYVGQSWESLTAELPPLEQPQFVVRPGEPGRVYARSGSRLFVRSLDREGWRRGAELGIGAYGELYPWLLVDRANPDHVTVGVKLQYGGQGTRTLLQRSLDAGQTWSNTLESLYRRLQEEGLEAIPAVTVPGELRDLTSDPHDPRLLYATGEQGGRVSVDGGATWRDSSTGLSIPLVRTLIRPTQGDGVFAGTPGGLYVSWDKGGTWTDANLWCQFTRNTRRELGGAAFIDAYWRARYYGMIDDEAAAAPIDSPQ
jgi:photosystem II stability/assembly factor-like uncharacterized protein